MIVDGLSDNIKAAWCAVHHISGDHEANICPLPAGYCAIIGVLALKARHLEHENQKLRTAPPIISAGGAGGSGGVGGRSAFGGGGGGGYFPGGNGSNS